MREKGKRLHVFIEPNVASELERLHSAYGLTLKRLVEISIMTLAAHEEEVFGTIKRLISPQAQSPSPPTS